MKKLLIVALLFAFSRNLYAEQWKPYAFEDAEGLHIVYLNPNSGSTIQNELSKMGKSGSAFVELDPKEVPNESIKYLKLDGRKLIVNDSKKLEDIQKQKEMITKKDALKEKLKLSDEDVSVLKEVVING